MLVTMPGEVEPTSLAGTQEASWVRRWEVGPAVGRGSDDRVPGLLQGTQQASLTSTTPSASVVELDELDELDEFDGVDVRLEVRVEVAVGFLVGVAVGVGQGCPRPSVAGCGSMRSAASRVGTAAREALTKS